MLRIYDPARIKIHVQLVHVDHVEPYLYIADLLASQAGAEDEEGVMMMMERGADEITFTSLQPTNSIAFVLTLPDDMTNQVDIFTSTILQPGAWILAATNLSHPGTNLLHWIDSNDWLYNDPPNRFYAAGDAQADSDGDGIPDAREILVYGTDPFNLDTDGDGMPDGWEIYHGFDPLDPSDAHQDADGDGFSNLAEYQGASNPTDPLSAPVLAFYVDHSSGSDSNTGAFNSRFASIGKALQTAQSNDYVFVFPGVYAGSMNRALSYQGKRLRVRSLAGPESTIVDAGGITNVFRFESGETRDAELKGFTVQGGVSSQGGGIFCVTSSPRIVDCIIQSNSAGVGGGVYIRGMLNHPARPVLSNNLIRFNYASTNGGGVFLRGASPDVHNSRIENNEANSRGGGLFSAENTYSVVSTNFTVSTYSIGSSPTVTVSSISFNLSKGNGSAAVFSGPPASSFTQYVESRPRILSTRFMGNRKNSPVVIQQEFVYCLIENSSIVNNVSTSSFAGVYIVQSAVVLNHTTISENRAKHSSASLGSGLFSHNPISTRRTIITNSVIWGNWPAGDQVYANVANNCRLYYSCYDSSTSGYIDNKIVVGGGVITNNPLITRIGTLTSNSPVRNAANSANPPAKDIHGESRPQGGGVDMGSDEYFDSNSDGFPDWWMKEIGLDPSATLDPAANHNTNELTNAQEYIAGTNPFAPVVDSDNDGLSDAAELYHGTDPNNWDTSGNLFPDGWLVRYGYDPLDPNAIDPNSDDDLDGLSNFDEMRYGTDPKNPDTDGDGFSDGVEVAQGSDPSDPDDLGDSENAVVLELVIGDHSGSQSERYRMLVGNKVHQSPSFGVVSTAEYAFVKGKAYPFEIQWVASNRETPDYDYTAKIGGHGGGAGWHAATNILLHDPDGVLGVHDESTFDFAAGKSGTLYILKVELEKVWSDQLPDRECYYMPGGHGAPKDTGEQFLLIGARSDNKVYVKADVSIEPDIPEIRSKVLFRLAKNTGNPASMQLTGTSTLSVDNVASINSDSFDLDSHQVVAGIDLDGDGHLSANEVLAISPHNMRFVSINSSVLAEAQVRIWLTLGAWAGQYVAAMNLEEFLDPTPEGSYTPVTISVNDSRLEHRVGLKLDSNCADTTAQEVVYGDQSLTSLIIATSKTLKSIIQGRLNTKKQEVVDFFNDPQNSGETSYEFEVLLVQPIWYEDHQIDDLDLFLAFGKADLNAYCTIRVDRATMQVNYARIVGVQTDLYDWDYTLDPIPARVQAGFPTLGSSGRVYRNMALLAHDVTTVIGYDMSLP